ncbi:MAG: LamG domain-containing protein, partial [Patescibacteria group bacterium]|nr:LamG domain-containing protein [Patescibacteria group bacterium]
FDEIQGTTVYDESGNNNTGIISGSAAVMNGVVGKAMSFNGTNYVNCGNNPSIKVTGSMTLIFWAKPSNVALPSRQNPICKAYGAELCITMEPNGQLSYFHGSAGTNNSPYFGWGTAGIFESNIWVHVAIVRDNINRKMYLYKNGKLVNAATWPSAYDPSSSASYNFLIGAGYVNRFYGFIDDVRIYSTVFTQAKIQQQYAEGLKAHQNLAVK